MDDLSDYLALFVHFQAVCDLLLIEHDGLSDHLASFVHFQAVCDLCLLEHE